MRLVCAMALCAALLSPGPAFAQAAADEDNVCLVVIAAAITRARSMASLPPDQQVTVRSWENAVGYFSGIVTASIADDETLAAAMRAARAEADRRDAYRSVVVCDERYRAGMRRLQSAMRPARPLS